MRSEYNLMGDPTLLVEAKALFNLDVVDRWDTDDINVFVEVDVEDDFTDWCEENGLLCVYVGDES